MRLYINSTEPLNCSTLSVTTVLARCIASRRPPGLTPCAPIGGSGSCCAEWVSLNRNLIHSVGNGFRGVEREAGSSFAVFPEIGLIPVPTAGGLITARGDKGGA